MKRTFNWRGVVLFVVLWVVVVGGLIFAKYSLCLPIPRGCFWLAGVVLGLFAQPIWGAVK